MQTHASLSQDVCALACLLLIAVKLALEDLTELCLPFTWRSPERLSVNIQGLECSAKSL